MRIGALLGIVVGVSASAGLVPLRASAQSPASSAVTSNTFVTRPFSGTVMVACANEKVKLAGELVLHIQSTQDANGGMHVKSSARPSHVEGVGDVSGNTYRGTGGTVMHEVYAGKSNRRTYTFVNNFRVIGEGPGNNFLLHVTTHYTINANGEVTADISLDNMDCR